MDKDYVALARISALVLAILIPSFALLHIAQSATAVQYLTFDFDERLSVQARQAIYEAAQLSKAGDTYNLRSIVQDLPAFFSSIKSVSAWQRPYHTAHLKVEALEPILKINSDKVLIEDFSVVSRNYYAEHAYYDKYAMGIADPVPLALNSDIQKGVVNAIENKLFDHYTFHVANQHAWYLSDRQDPAFTLCCNASSLPVKVIKKTYSKLKQELLSKNKGKAQWLADVRFHDQIIVSMHTGGRYGQNI